MARKAGIELVDPQVVWMHPVALNFDQIPAKRSLQLMESSDGRQAIFNGKKVRFEARQLFSPGNFSLPC